MDTEVMRSSNLAAKRLFNEATHPTCPDFLSNLFHSRKPKARGRDLERVTDRRRVEIAPRSQNWELQDLSP